jgi:hypothetical protein
MPEAGLSSKSAPTASLAREWPNWSPASVFEALVRPAAVFEGCTDCQHVAVSREGESVSEEVTRLGIRGLHIGLLGPDSAIQDEYIERASIGGGVVALDAVYTDGVAVFEGCRHRQCGAVPREGEEYPKLSPAWVFEAFTYACWDQMALLRVKT